MLATVLPGHWCCGSSNDGGVMPIIHIITCQNTQHASYIPYIWWTYIGDACAYVYHIWCHQHQHCLLFACYISWHCYTSFNKFCNDILHNRSHYPYTVLAYRRDTGANNCKIRVPTFFPQEFAWFSGITVFCNNVCFYSMALIALQTRKIIKCNKLLLTMIFTFHSAVMTTFWQQPNREPPLTILVSMNCNKIKKLWKYLQKCNITLFSCV